MTQVQHTGNHAQIDLRGVVKTYKSDAGSLTVLKEITLVIVLSALASLWPALRAAQVSVREALAYE
jgi:ABC-type lipoprotein release transport system permease subunit